MHSNRVLGLARERRLPTDVKLNPPVGKFPANSFTYTEIILIKTTVFDFMITRHHNIGLTSEQAQLVTAPEVFG